MASYVWRSTKIPDPSGSMPFAFWGPLRSNRFPYAGSSHSAARGCSWGGSSRGPGSQWLCSAHDLTAPLPSHRAWWTWAWYGPLEDWPLVGGKTFWLSGDQRLHFWSLVNIGNTYETKLFPRILTSSVRDSFTSCGMNFSKLIAAADSFSPKE